MIAVLTTITLAGTFALQFRLGSEVIVNGQSVGFVSNNDQLEAILQDVESLVQAASNGETLDLDVQLIRMVVRQSDVTPEFTLRQNILASSDQMVEAYAIYVNEALICATLVAEEAFAMLDEVRDQYNTGREDTIEFLDTVAVRREFVPVMQILEPEEIAAVLNGQARHIEIYTVPQPEELYMIAERFEMDLDELQEMNRGLGEMVEPGTKVNVLRRQDVIRVQTQAREMYNRELVYEIEEVEDNSLPIGSRLVSRAGQPGLARVEAIVVRINGNERERIQTSESVIRHPQPGRVRIGTMPGGTPIRTQNNGWLRPVAGPVSSPFGPRWGRMHEGIDITGNYGAAIRASVGGRVTLADWNGGYGLTVRINSGDGYSQLYAHLSEIRVIEGQQVQQGDIIGLLGNTGSSTGPHLHFEIRKNNVPLDPLRFINR
jgi:murein DD-endopeptidase MepM/ murein hydrolase activator NlpD